MHTVPEACKPPRQLEKATKRDTFPEVLQGQKRKSSYSPPGRSY